MEDRGTASGQREVRVRIVNRKVKPIDWAEVPRGQHEALDLVDPMIQWKQATHLAHQGGQLPPGPSEPGTPGRGSRCGVL